MNNINPSDQQYESLLNKLNNLHKEVALSVDRTELSQSLTQIINRSEDELNKTKTCIDRLKSTSDQLSRRMDELSPVLTSVGPLLDKLERLTQLERLLDRFESIKQINLTLEPNLVNPRNAKDCEIRVMAITQAFNKLVNEFKVVNRSDKNEEFKRYLFQIIEHWKRVLYEKFEQKFIEAFEAIDWPKTSDDHKPEPSQDSINTFRAYFNALLTIDIDNNPTSDDFNRNQLSKVIVLPMCLMLKPIKKRFQFHFMEAKSKLNRPEKPEWYLSQTLLWIRHNQTFLNNIIDPLLKESSSLDIIPSKLQLICGLIECVSVKLKSDLPSIVLDDKLFSHTVDEVFIFNKELDNIEPNILELFPNCNLMNIFSADPNLFSRILSLEKKKSAEFVEFILESKTAWNEICGPESNDELRICESADNFVLMLQSITNRCSFLSESSLQYKFVELELEILDDFRLRLIQLIHNCDHSWPHSHQYFAIINSINYLIIVLDEWKNLPFFVQISENYFPNGTVFDEVIGLLEHISKEFVAEIRFSFIDHLKNKLQNYQTFKWFCMKPSDNCLSSNVSDLLHSISTNVVLLQKSLANSLFDIILVEIADHLDKILMEDIIMKNNFNEFGAKQLECDLTKGFLALFRLYMSRPDAHFASTLEGVKLLTLERGSSLLLQSVLKEGRNADDCKRALKEMSIHSISADLALNIIRKRLYTN